MINKLVLETVSTVPTTEYDLAFLQGMIRKMEVSYYKYGPVADAKGKIDTAGSILIRLAKYYGTDALRLALEAVPQITASKNTEFLQDAANISMMESMFAGKSSYKPTDSKESPGRILIDEWDGSREVSQRANDGTPQ